MSKLAPKYYKVLLDGRSFNGGMLTWSLPSRGKPGDWHEVDGPLRLCSNGLHLTSEPTYRRAPKSICYEVEIEGETLGPSGDELVVRKCRLIRRVSWSEFKSLDKPEIEVETKDSPALTLLSHVWGSIDYRSHALANDAMQRALSLAIECGLEFGVDDFKEIAKRFRASYWLHIEGAYSRACGGSQSYISRSHGPNPSAYQAIEKHLGRKPFIVMESASGPKVRLCEGRRFDWHLDMKKKVTVWVTSFADDNTYLTACSYKDGSRSKIDKRFKITHEAIAEYHAAIREHDKNSKNEKVPA